MDLPERPIHPAFDDAATILHKKFGIDWEELFTMRKRIHMEPEIGFEEFKTKEKIIEYLVKHGADKEAFRYYAITGFTYDIVGTAPPKGEKFVIGFRSELDGLRMQELNTFPHASKIPKRAHMCGHDGHMATLIGFANILLNNRQALPANKTIRLIFQPSEEMDNGGDTMVKEGSLEGLDEVYAMHIVPIQYGLIGIVQNKAFSSGYLKVDIELEYTAESPLNSAISAACAVHTQAHNISTLDLCPGELGIFTIGKIVGDEIKASLHGTIRAERDDLLTLISKRIQEIVSSTAKLYHLKHSVLFSLYTPPVHNAKIPSKYFYEATASLYGPDSIINESGNATEDFGFMTKVVPGAMISVGQRYPGEEIIMNHSPYFEYNEKVIPPCIQIYLKLVALRLGASF